MFANFGAEDVFSSLCFYFLFSLFSFLFSLFSLSLCLFSFFLFFIFLFFHSFILSSSLSLFLFLRRLHSSCRACVGLFPNARTPPSQNVHSVPEHDVKLVAWLVKQWVPSLMSRGWRSMCQVRVGRQKVTSLAALSGGGKVEGSKSDQASLGGNSLLDCVVYGRVAGAAGAKYVLGDRRSLPLRRSLVEARLRGRKVTRPVWEEIHFWIAWFTPAWLARHVPSTSWASVRRSRLSRHLLVEAGLRAEK